MKTYLGRDDLNGGNDAYGALARPIRDCFQEPST